MQHIEDGEQAVFNNILTNHDIQNHTVHGIVLH